LTKKRELNHEDRNSFPGTAPYIHKHPFPRSALQDVLGKYVEAAIIAALLAFNAILGFFQEGRAQATLAAPKSRLESI